MLPLLNNSHVENIAMPILKMRKLTSREVNNWTEFLQQITLGREPKLKSHVSLSDSSLGPGMCPFPFCVNKWFMMIRNLLVVIGEAGLTVLPGLDTPTCVTRASLQPQTEKKSMQNIFIEVVLEPSLIPGQRWERGRWCDGRHCWPSSPPSILTR